MLTIPPKGALIEMKNNWKQLLRLTVLIATLASTAIYAQQETEVDDDVLDLNKIVVKGELYIWNRVSDVLDLFRLGIGAGGSIGVDACITKYVNLGAMYNNEHGVDFPHFIPPFWLAHYYQQKPIFNIHDGEYKTAAFGPYRHEEMFPTDGNVTFNHNPWEIRLEVAILLHVYAQIDLAEVFDFIAGIACFDPSGDDQEIDPSARRRPVDQLGRGVCNICFGLLEIPINVIRVTEDEGDMPGISKGVALGVWRGLVREVVGVVELVTFPFGWSPIIEPEYVLQKTKTSYWTVRRPSFHKRY